MVQKDGDRFKMLVTESLCVRHQHLKLVTNTFCLQHPSPALMSPFLWLVFLAENIIENRTSVHYYVQSARASRLLPKAPQSLISCHFNPMNL